jgi:Tfp pilus assembly protein PilO
MAVDSVFPRRVAAALEAYRWAWVGCALLIGFGLMVHIAGVRPRVRRAEALQRTFMDGRRRLATVQRADSAVRRYLSTQKALQSFRRELPDEEAIGAMGAEIEGFAEARGIESDPIRFRSDGMGDLMLVRYVVELELRGAYPRLKEFLADLGNSPSLFCVEGFALENRGGDAERAELRLVVATYARAGMRLLPPAR